MSSRIEKLFRPELRQLQAYHVQSTTNDMVKLDAMENPFALPAELHSEWLQALANTELNRYPDANADSLRRSLKQTLSLPASFELLLGNGSDELIQLLCLAVINAPSRKTGRPVVMAPEPGFAMYRFLALAAGLEYVGVPLLTDSFELDMLAMLAAIERHQPELLFIAYPNNPTGNLFKTKDVKLLIESTPGLLIIDEAYQPFAEQTTLNEFAAYKHVLLLRTLSKLGLAGIRLGVLAGAPACLTELNKLRLPYNINVLTQVTAEFACKHYSVFLQQAELIRTERELLFNELVKIDKVQPYKSRANFILFRVAGDQADAVFKKLLDSKVLVKNLSAHHPLLKSCLRVTVGTAAENIQFLRILRSLLD